MSKKRIIKNSAFLYVRLIVTMFVGIFTSRFVLSALGASDFGLYNVVGGVVSMMAFVNTMMVTTTYRFLAYEEGKPDGDVNKVFNISFSLHIAAGIIVLLLAGTIGIYYIGNFLVVEQGKQADAYFVFAFSVINVLVDILGIPFRGLLIANEKFAITVPIEIGTKVLTLFVAILLNYVPGNHLRYYAVLITVVHCFNPLSYVVYSVMKYYDTVKWKFHRKISDYKPMFQFTGWNTLEVAAVMGEGQGSAIIINRFFGTVLNASFGVARRLDSLVKMFSNGVSQAMVPQITKNYSAGNYNKASRLAIACSKYASFLMLIPIMPLLLETDYLLNLWLKEVPVYTAIFVQAMLIRAIIGGTQNGIAQLIDASGDIKYFKIFRSIAMLSALPLAYIAFKKGYAPYSISLIYIVTSLVYFIGNQVLLSVVLRFDSIEFLKKSTIRIVLVCVFQVPLFFIIKLFPSSFIRFFAISLFSELILLVSIYFVGIDTEEKQMAFGFVADKFPGFKRIIPYLP